MTRTDTPPALDERSILQTMLAYVRETAIEKVAGLSDELVVAAPVPTSPLTNPASLLNHLRWVEFDWIETRFLGGEDLGPWTEEDPDGEMTEALSMTADEVIAAYREQTKRCDELVADVDLDTLSVEALRDFHPNLRWILNHLVEETARHNGHLDILRELADGSTGA
ncbi:DinB family protein [Solicola gregarius]|uniref:DinB family protein n=1 Tax=Solicola gregarius TaxID=2908642 RepID=A0AA46TEU4_9ACTN|nr:DinB family protein [Solicola gregarius]UYM03845.1 DinB family protein [Solicola gregarius]